MFNKTYFKLTSLYLVVFMIISLFFSISLYQISMQAVKNEMRWGGDRITRLILEHRLPQSFREKYVVDISDHYEESKNAIIEKLIIINFFVFIGGGILCYLLAKWTLRPIEEAHKSLEQFTADASHELRTPLAAMRTEIEVALMNPNLSLGQSKQQLKSNLEEVQKLSELTGTMLSLARFNEDGNFEITSISVKSLLEDSIGRVKVEAEEKNIKIELKKFSEKLNIFGAKETVQQAIIILLENAIKYSPKSSKVSISVKENKKFVDINITDKGIGIAEKDIKYIFNRFYRADSARSKKDQSGNGLGLSIAKNIIDRNGGSVSVVSKVGRGSTFTVSLQQA